MGLGSLKIGPILIIIYLMSDFGSIIGGWASSALIKRGWSVNKSRKTTMFVWHLRVVPVYFAAQTTELWLAVGLIGLALAAHSAWSANLFTLTRYVSTTGSGFCCWYRQYAWCCWGYVRCNDRWLPVTNNRKLCFLVYFRRKCLSDRIYRNTITFTKIKIYNLRENYLIFSIEFLDLLSEIQIIEINLISIY